MENITADEIEVLVKHKDIRGVCTVCGEPKEKVKMHFVTVSFDGGEDYINHHFPQGEKPEMICEECGNKE